jgi:hypothetical protein
VPICVRNSVAHLQHERGLTVVSRMKISYSARLGAGAPRLTVFARGGNYVSSRQTFLKSKNPVFPFSHSAPLTAPSANPLRDLES